MASLTEHVMINKLGDDLNDAITFVGGDTSQVTNIMQYPGIIKEQLSSGNTLKEIILEGDSCIIEADKHGYDYYNTEYAVGVKTGLNPGALYIRLCTAVKDIEPIYIDLTRVNCSSGGSVDINEIIDELLESNEFIDEIGKEISVDVNNLQNDVNLIQNNISQIQSDVINKVDMSIYDADKVLIENKLEMKAEKTEVREIVIDELNANISEGIDIEELNW